MKVVDVRTLSKSALAMAMLYIRREWDGSTAAIEETAEKGLAPVDQKLLKHRYGAAAVEVGLAVERLCKQDLANRR